MNKNLTPLDHDTTAKAWRDLFVLVAAIVMLLVSAVAYSQELQPAYDASFFHREHRELGINLPRMTVVYEAHSFTDDGRLRTQYPEGTIKLNEQYLLKVLQANPTAAVLLDWETLPAGYWTHREDVKERLKRRNHLAKSVQAVRELAKKHGCDNRHWGLYEQLPEIVGNDPTKHGRGLRSLTVEWYETKPPILELIDFVCCDMSVRWESTEDFARYTERVKRQAELAKMLGKPTVAMIKPHYHALAIGKRGLKEHTMRDVLRIVEINKRHFDSVTLWTCLEWKKDKQSSDRARIGMALCMDALGDK